MSQRSLSSSIRGFSDAEGVFVNRASPQPYLGGAGAKDIELKLCDTAGKLGGE